MKNKLLVGLGVLLVLVALPTLVLAQTGSGVTGISGGQTLCNATVNNLVDLLCRIGNLLNKVIPVLIVLAILFFVWGVVLYVVASDEEAKSTGRNRMIWGIIGLVVIVGVWALVRFVANTFGISGPTDIAVPTVPFGI